MKKRVLAILISLLLLFSAFAPVAGAEGDVARVKNVILLIGDGMGPNNLEWTKSIRNVSLYMDKLPYQGYSKTNSYSGTTDSAAGGTALSSGHRTFNSNLGEMGFQIAEMDVLIAKFMNTCEVAKAVGKRAGILTSDSNSGATPASFSSHTADRGSSDDITNQQLASNIDLIWAEENGLVDKKVANENNWKFVSNLADAKALPANSKSFGVFKEEIQYGSADSDAATLSKLTTLAIKQLDCEEGFFLMVEGAHIDKNSHNNDEKHMMDALIEFDKAVGNALEFAKKDGETLVIVTADHETGKITKQNDGTYKYTKSGHSSTDVPLRVYGSDKLIKNGQTIKNFNISRFTAEQLGYTEKYPVVEFNYFFIPDLFKTLGLAFVGLFK